MIVSVSVAALFATLGSPTLAGTLTAAVFVTLPVALAETFAVTVYTILAPLGRFTVSIKFVPLIATGSHPLAPPLCDVHAHDQVVIFVGLLSVIIAPMTLLGPLLVTVIV
jgi:hypothetical protein